MFENLKSKAEFHKNFLQQSSSEKIFLNELKLANKGLSITENINLFQLHFSLSEKQFDCSFF